MQKTDSDGAFCAAVRADLAADRFSVIAATMGRQLEVDAASASPATPIATQIRTRELASYARLRAGAHRNFAKKYPGGAAAPSAAAPAHSADISWTDIQQCARVQLLNSDQSPARGANGRLSRGRPRRRELAAEFQYPFADTGPVVDLIPLALDARVAPSTAAAALVAAVLLFVLLVAVAVWMAAGLPTPAPNQASRPSLQRGGLAPGEPTLV